MSQRVKPILSGMFSFVVILLLLEGISRIGATVIHDYWSAKAANVDMWNELSPDLGWVNRPGFKGEIRGVYREFPDTGTVFENPSYEPASHKWRIAFLGDSNTFGWGVPTESTFVELLKDLQPHFSTINLAFPAYSSYQGLQVLRKFGIALHPDLIVVSFNANDRRFVLNKESVDGVKHFQNLYLQETRRQFRELVRKCYVSRALEQMLRLVGLIKGESESIPKQVQLDTLHARVDPESYRQNLVSIVREARAQKIQVAFLLLKDNPAVTATLDKGIYQLERGEYDSAVGTLKITERINYVCSALARKYLSKAYLQKGMGREAEAALLVDPTSISTKSVVVDGGTPIYRDREYNQIMREVASEYRVELIDAASVLDTHPSMYTDNCHFDEQGHRAVANLLSTRLEEILEAKGRQLGTRTH
jgi:lysophospholipase L1-like esterase